MRWQKEMADSVLGEVAAAKFLICPVASGHVARFIRKPANSPGPRSVNGKFRRAGRGGGFGHGEFSP